MAKLNAWVKKHLGSRLSSKPRQKKQSTDQPPFLPSPRRPITPTSFGTSARFFQLPYDIRRIILLMAFGKRILHMDIVRQEEAWQWRGAVCHRVEALSRLPFNKRYTWQIWHGPWRDQCLSWLQWIDEHHKGEVAFEFIEEYKFGMMGFLLSCRQAYTEGIDVLFSANCISIQSEPLLLHLPQLIPLNRLASITSLEIVVTAHGIKQDNDSLSFNNLDHLKPILDNIVTHCHHLRIFCLSFMVNGPVLSLVDTFYRSMRLRNMRVELPTQADWPPCNSTDDHPSEAPVDGSFIQRSLWRSLDNEEPTVQNRSMERYPYPPLKLPVLDGDESVESIGYWLADGDKMPIVLAPTSN